MAYCEKFSAERLKGGTDIHPSAALGEGYQLLAGQLNGAVAASGCWENRVKPLEGFVQIDRYLRVGNPKGTDPAHGMAGIRQRLLWGEHLSLDAKACLKLGTVDLPVSGGYHQDAASRSVQGEGLSDAGALDAQGLGGQLHSGAGSIQFSDCLIFAKLLQVCAYGLYRHNA